MEAFMLSDVHFVGNKLLDAQHRIIISYMDKVYTHLLAEDKGYPCATNNAGHRREDYVIFFHDRLWPDIFT